MADDGTPIPECILASPHPTLWGSKFNDMHRRNQMFSLVIVGPVGSGKSWAAISIGYLLDRKYSGEPRFNIDHVCFNAREFAKLVSKPLPKGTVIIIDDAGLVAASSDAITREVKEISKIFQSIRSRNYCIIWTLPNFGLLASNIQVIVQNYGEMMGVIKSKEQSLMKFQEIQASGKVKKLYFHSPSTNKREYNPFTNMSTIKKVKNPILHIDKPPKELVDAYEEKKLKSMQEFYANSRNRMDGRRGQGGQEFKDIVKYIKDNIDDYVDYKGKVDIAKIRYFGIKDEEGNKINVTGHDAQQISKLINEERKESGLIDDEKPTQGRHHDKL